MELMSKGETNQSEIARILQVDRSTICRDVDYLRQQAKENIARYVNERLPEEYEKCLVGLNSILREAWRMSQADENVKGDKIKALALAKECYFMKMDLLTNATVVDDAIRFVSQKSNDNLKPLGNSNEVDKEESNEPDYDEDEDQLEEEEKQGEETEAITTIATTNQVF
jgi:hypothetical protein